MFKIAKKRSSELDQKEDDFWFDELEKAQIKESANKQNFISKIKEIPEKVKESNKIVEIMDVIKTKVPKIVRRKSRAKKIDLEDTFKIGDSVFWTSHNNKNTSRKEGYVVTYLPAHANGVDFLPENLKTGRKLMFDNKPSGYPRYMVVVKKSDKKGIERTLVYTPRAGMVEKLTTKS